MESGQSESELIASIWKPVKAAAGWAQNKLTEIHEGVMDFVGEAISIVEGVFTGDTVPAQLVEMGIDVIKEIPEIAEAIPDIDWVLNNFVDTGGICHNIKEIVDNSIIDDVVNVVEDVGGAIGGAISVKIQ